VRREKEATGEIPQLTKTLGADGTYRRKPDPKSAEKRRLRRAPTAVPTIKLDPDGLINAWDYASDDEKIQLVKERGQSIARIQRKLKAAETQIFAPEQADDGLDIPASLRSAPPGDGR